MRKFLLALILVSFTSATFAQNGKDRVISAISSFNEKANTNTLVTAEQRSWWQAVLNVVTIVVADVAGAYAGVTGTIHVAGAVGLATGGTGVAIVAGVAGVVGAAGASNGAYQGLNRTAATQLNYGNLNIVLPGEYAFYASMGKDHNEVLHKNYFLEEGLSGYYRSLLDAEQIRIIEGSESQETFRFLQELGLTYIQSGRGFDYLADELINKQLMTATGKDILSAFFEKYKSCASPKDMENLINLSIEETNQTDLEQKEKLSLIAAFMVASESPFYQNHPTR